MDESRPAQACPGRRAERRLRRESDAAYQDWPASVGAPSPLNSSGAERVARRIMLFEI